MTRDRRPGGRTGRSDIADPRSVPVERRLIAAGDDLVSDLGLTSARWQVLGAIALAPAAETVARLARAMGLHRQGVQRIVNELAAEGIVVLGRQSASPPRQARAPDKDGRGALSGRRTTAKTLGEEPRERSGREGTINSAHDVVATLRKKLELAAFDD